MDAFATSISIALQYGVPLEDLCTKFSHMRFEPSGFTNNKQIPIAKSIMDYIFRYLSLKFLGEAKVPEEEAVNPNEAVAEEARRSGPASDQIQPTLFDEDDTSDPVTATAPPADDETSLVGQTIEAFLSTTRTVTQTTSVTETRTAYKNQEDAPPCATCGAITVRSGACYVCHSCGSTTGCG